MVQVVMFRSQLEKPQPPHLTRFCKVLPRHQMGVDGMSHFLGIDWLGNPTKRMRSLNSRQTLVLYTSVLCVSPDVSHFFILIKFVYPGLPDRFVHAYAEQC